MYVDVCGNYILPDYSQHVVLLLSERDLTQQAEAEKFQRQILKGQDDKNNLKQQIAHLEVKNQEQVYSVIKFGAENSEANVSEFQDICT